MRFAVVAAAIIFTSGNAPNALSAPASTSVQGNAGTFQDAANANSKGDFQRALVIWRALAEQGDARSQFALAVMYDLGRGVPQDKNTSLMWYKRAAAGGDIASQFALGSAYTAGDGLPKDYVEARKWLLRAANQGDGVAQLALGGIYDQGLGTPQDLIEGLKWLILSANNLNAGGTNALGARAASSRDSLIKAMSPDQVLEGQRRAGQWVKRLENAAPR